MLEQISYRYLREGALREASETGGLENVPYYVGLPIFSRIAHIILAFAGTFGHIRQRVCNYFALFTKRHKRM